MNSPKASRRIPPYPIRGRGFAKALALIVAATASALTTAAAHADSMTVEESGQSPIYGLSADAAAGVVLAADGFDPASSDSAAIWLLQANLLHRIEAPGWGLVLSHQLDLSGQTATEAMPVFSPSMTVYEAYARLDMGGWTQLFLGRRRMGLGIGTIFAPGDVIDPHSGFWDQKMGFRGLDIAASIGSDVSLRAAIGLDRNLDAYMAGLAAKAAALTLAAVPADAAAAAAAANTAAAYSLALDGAAGPADPRLFEYALSIEAQLGTLQVAAAGVYSPDTFERPSLGASIDLGGLILQAEGAVELTGAPDWYGTASVRYTWSSGPMSLTLSMDYAYNGKAGLLAHTHYLLPYASYTIDQLLNVYARALVGLEEPSALLSTGLILYPAQGFDLEISGIFGLGDPGSEFASIGGFASIQSPGSGSISAALGLSARVHF